MSEASSVVISGQYLTLTVFMADVCELVGSVSTFRHVVQRAPVVRRVQLLWMCCQVRRDDPEASLVSSVAPFLPAQLPRLSLILSVCDGSLAATVGACCATSALSRRSPSSSLTWTSRWGCATSASTCWLWAGCPNAAAWLSPHPETPDGGLVHQAHQETGLHHQRFLD